MIRAKSAQSRLLHPHCPHTMFWDDHLDLPTVSALPFDFKVENGPGGDTPVAIPAEYPVVLAAVLLLVHRLTGDEDVVVASAAPDGRLLYTRVQLTGVATWGDFCQLVATAYAAGCAHADSFPGITAVPNVPIGVFPQDAPAAFPWTLTPTRLAYPATASRERAAIVADQLAAVASTPSSTPLTAVSLLTASQTLPLPSADLHWGEFRGPIHEIFGRNAEAHPDRVCVVELAEDPAAEPRTFSYHAIHTALNVVAGYLHAQGIVVGDVVTVYAARNVDLVVAVMGVLKAGATFLVIDPAYPPARQNVYLQVAKPLALVVLGRAGVLDSEVETYISENLTLKARIDGLVTSPQSVEGTTGTGALSGYSAFGAAAPPVTVSPEDSPTLSFTSGSEGLPKGVLGRHFLLTHYFPWMARTFGLSDASRFTMLSGIAHDPVQRDMFTPLFLGAQLWIPTETDIGTPGRLAEWMARTKVTVTHLTPAMGQLLAADAVAEIAHLQNAFFVGDILTKRDCMRLQALAPNVAIINMYGTTETQRAVSFFRVPLRTENAGFLAAAKDTIPAGRGMENVQLCVVNRASRTPCGVGEVGEIYVRAGGLARGYRGLPELNAEKFVVNWMGTRAEDPSLPAGYDRLYRTGDLGRYTPAGDVEVSGRADDQVKIRGFRIELGEIDTHLSQHPAVRENITLVRANHNGEKALFSWVVFHTPVEVPEGADPVVARLVGAHDTLVSIRNHLKTRLAAYAVPGVIIPVARLPLNPNGKVDKPKLAIPSVEQMAAVAEAGNLEALTATEEAIREVWWSVLPEKVALGPTDLFFDAGGHLILATRMILQVRRALGVEVPLGAIYKHPTLGGFARAVAGEAGEVATAYAEDAEQLVAELPSAFPTKGSIAPASPPTVFLTGATGFLGSFLLGQLVARGCKVVCHVRAADSTAAMARLRTAGTVYTLWDGSGDVTPFLGDLAAADFGNAAAYQALADSVDVVVHNGAAVHWVYPYATLRDANVVSTFNLLALCAQGRPKTFSFVSSTSVVDVDHFLAAPVAESDLLAASATGLPTGYGQLKWVGERLVRAARSRGLSATVVRPGYVSGSTRTGAQNTDDYLLRMLKGCVQLGSGPVVASGVNMVPVDHVARVVVAAALSPLAEVCQVTAHPRIALGEYVESVNQYGHAVVMEPYAVWARKLSDAIAGGADNALFPLLHMVLDGLDKSQAPELEDSNTVAVLQADAAWTGEDALPGAGVDTATVGVYLAYLQKIGWLEGGRGLPQVEVSEEAVAAAARVSGRGGK